MRRCKICGEPFPRFPFQASAGICEDCQHDLLDDPKDYDIGSDDAIPRPAIVEAGNPETDQPADPPRDSSPPVGSTDPPFTHCGAAGGASHILLT